MTEWWESLSALQQIFAVAAFPATLVLILQTVLLLFGAAGQGGPDGGGPDQDFLDPDGDAGAHGGGHDSGLRIFTIQAVVAFFAIFGWTGIVADGGTMHDALTIFIALAAGAAAMIGMAFFFKAALKLQSSGNIDRRNALGKTATVYIPILPNRSGTGKIHAVIQERLTEMDAVTDIETAIPTGAEVVCVSVSNLNTACVVPVKK